MDRARSVVLAAGLLVAITLAVSPPSLAAVTIGSDLSRTPNVLGHSGGDTTDTIWNTALPASLDAPGGLAAPSKGVIVRFRLNNSQDTIAPIQPTDPVQLRTLRNAGSGQYTGVATEASPHPVPNVTGTHTFATRLPIEAGDLIGLDVVDADDFVLLRTMYNHPPGSGAVYAYTILRIGDGATVTPLASQANFEVLLNADIESDADGDGFGDETQDQCPTSAATQALCLPAPPATSPAAPAAVSDRAAPVGLASFNRTLGLRSTLRRGLAGKVSSNEATDITGAAEIAGRLGQRLGLKAARPVVVASGKVSLNAPGVATLRLIFTNKAKRKLMRARKVALTLRINLTDKAHNTATLTHRVTLKR